MTTKAEKAGEILPQPTSSATITVACKIPNGLILQLCKPMDRSEPVLGGGRKNVKEWHPYGDKVKVHGPARPFGANPVTRVVGGYALTEGVPARFFAQWLEQHKDDAVVTNQMIIGHENTEYLVGWAKERKGLLSGLQPLNVTLDGKGNLSDPRIPKGNMKIETADREEAA